jgi:L-ascorbate metabolism protein UlaG (beta-lactamase superfamily)
MFLTVGAAMAAGFASAQRLVVKRRMKKNVLDPTADVPPVADADFEAAVKTLEATTIFDDEKRARALEVVQNAIDKMVDSREFLAAMHESTSAAKLRAVYAKFPVMRWYDREFDRVLDELERTKVTGARPAVWYIYNMGIVVKTKTCSFGIDVCHRQAPRLAEKLDFLLVSHNHGDHYSMNLMRKMSALGKPVGSNFHLCAKWYSREFEKTFKFRDVTIHMTAADHQKWLPWAMTCFEVVCGEGADAFTIFHSGDCNRHDHLRPRGRPDLYFGHCAIGLDFMSAAKDTMPAKLFLPVHHQELGHIHTKWRCVAFHDEPKKIVTSLRDAGFNAAMPVWGDRIV